MRIEIQSKEKLTKDLEKVMSSYRHLSSGMESMAELHQIPPLGPLRKENTWQQTEQDIKAFIQPIEQAAASQDLTASKENLVKFIVTPIRIYTKLASLENQIEVKKETLILDSFECIHRLKEDTPLISPFSTEYHAWQTYLQDQLKINVPELEITKLIK